MCLWHTVARSYVKYKTFCDGPEIDQVYISNIYMGKNPAHSPRIERIVPDRDPPHCRALTTISYSTIFNNILQYSIIFYNILQYSTIFHHTPPCPTIFYNILQHSIIFYNVLQYSTIFYHSEVEEAKCRGFNTPLNRWFGEFKAMLQVTVLAWLEE